MRVSRRDVTVGATKFSPGLLQEHNPHLVEIGLAEYGPIAALEDRNKVVDEHLGVDALLTNQHPVDPLGLEDHLMAEDSLDAGGVLGDRRQAGQEVTVPDVALLDICRLNAALDHHRRGHHLAYTFPHDFTVGHLVAKRSSARGELGVYKISA